MKNVCHTFLKNSKAGTHIDSWLMYHVYLNQGKGPISHGVKSLDRFYVAILPCPTVMLSGKHELKIFQHYGYFSSDSAAVGLLSDPLTALVLSVICLCSAILKNMFGIEIVLFLDALQQKC